MHPWRSGWSKAVAIACGLLAPGSTWAAGPATIPGSTWGGAPATFDVAYTAAALAEGGFLQVGPSLRQQMKRLELTAVHGADFLGTTKADCHYTREEDTNSGALPRRRLVRLARPRRGPDLRVVGGHRRRRRGHAVRHRQAHGRHRQVHRHHGHPELELRRQRAADRAVPAAAKVTCPTQPWSAGARRKAISPARAGKSPNLPRPASGRASPLSPGAPRRIFASSQPGARP